MNMYSIQIPILIENCAGREYFSHVRRSNKSSIRVDNRFNLKMIQ